MYNKNSIFMKRLFFYTLILFSFFLLPSCSDDKKDNPTPDETTFKNNDLALTVSNFSLTGREATLKDNVLTFTEAMPGETQTIFNITKNGNTITGENANSNRTLTLTGTIEGSKLTANIAVEMKTSLAGKWKFVNNGTTYPVSTTLVTPKDKIIFGDGEITPAEFEAFMDQTLGATILPQYLDGLTFETNGNLIASYTATPGSDFTDSPTGSVLYNVVNNQVFLAANIAAMLPKSGSKADNSGGGLLDILQMVEKGLPLYLKSNTDGTVQIYVDRTMMLPFASLLTDLAPMIPDDGIGAMVKPLLPQISTIIEESTEFTLGFNLQPAE